MIYRQYRLARSNGRIVLQSRHVQVTTKPHALWKFWLWGVYTSHYEYGPWINEELPEV